MESLLQNTALSWLCLVALFAFVELFFLRYRMIWLSVGCTVGLITALCSGALWLQIMLAVFVSVVLLWFSRSWVKQVRCDDAIHEILSEEQEEGGVTTDVSHSSGITPVFMPENDTSILVLPQSEKQTEVDDEASFMPSLFNF